MSVFNEAEFKEGLVSELSVFDLPSTQISVTDGYYNEIRPLSQVSDVSPVEFKISGQNSMDYVDLKNSQIYVRLKVEKTDGTAIMKREKVGLANLFLQALFSSTEVTLQNKATMNCNYNLYRAYIHTMLNYGTEAVKSQILNCSYKMILTARGSLIPLVQTMDSLSELVSLPNPDASIYKDPSFTICFP